VTSHNVDDGALIEAYDRLGSVWRVGDEFGIAGQAVHRRLRLAGVTTGNRVSKLDRLRITEVYSSSDKLDLAKLARELGRTKPFVCRIANEMGLTNRRRQRLEATKAKLRVAAASRWILNPHPRGMFGKTHTPETKARVSVASKQYWSTAKAFGIGLMSPEVREKRALAMSLRSRSMKVTSRARGGRRPDLGSTWFRSSWEANYARYLNLLVRMGVVSSWEYEPETFWFSGIKRGVMSYLPDFKVFYKNDPTPEYIEIKGWVQSKDKVKWRRMAKYHPHIKLVVIKEKEYNSIANKWKSALPEWESARGTPKVKGMPS